MKEGKIETAIFLSLLIYFKLTKKRDKHHIFLISVKKVLRFYFEN